MLPYADREMPPLWTLLHDNDPKHTSHTVKSWLDENQVNIMPWPAQSRDLHPIENLWMMVKRQIGNNIFKNGNDLMMQIEKERNAIPDEYINKLIVAMSNRCRAVIKNKFFLYFFIINLQSGKCCVTFHFILSLKYIYIFLL